MALVIAGLMLIIVAAVRAQTAYRHRFYGVEVSRPPARSAIQFAVAGVFCFIVAKVVR